MYFGLGFLFSFISNYSLKHGKSLGGAFSAWVPPLLGELVSMATQKMCRMTGLLHCICMHMHSAFLKIITSH